METSARVGIVGGGLAGVAAAVALASRGVEVELFEAGPTLGGRATAQIDPETGELIDYCQHIGMGCCTNFLQLCNQLGVRKQIEPIPRLHFFTKEGRRSDLAALPGLPAPLHLAASLLRLRFLRLKERWRIIKALRELAAPIAEEDADLSMLRWLRLHDQSPHVIERFWSALLFPLLGESLEQASLMAGRRMMLQAYLLNRAGYVLHLPQERLRRILGEPAQAWLEQRKAKVHLETPVRMILGSTDRCQGLLLENGQTRVFDVVIAAASWRQLGPLLAEGLKPAISQLRQLEQWDASPIVGVHLWFDRPLTPLSHAILIDGAAQWLFRRHPRTPAHRHDASGFHYEAVLRPSPEIKTLPSETLVSAVCNDLAQIWPASRDAKLLRSRVVSEPHAVFSSISGCEAWRPLQETAAPNLMLAGDWTQTGWPSTMESAVRSGNLAAEAVLRYLGRGAPVLTPDLEPDRLAKRLFPHA